MFKSEHYLGDLRTWLLMFARFVLFDIAVFYTMQLMSMHSSSKALRSVSHIHYPLSCLCYTRFVFSCYLAADRL